MRCKTRKGEGRTNLTDSNHTEKTTDTHADAKPATDTKTKETHDAAKGNEPAKDSKTTEIHEK